MSNLLAGLECKASFSTPQASWTPQHHVKSRHLSLSLSLSQASVGFNEEGGGGGVRDERLLFLTPEHLSHPASTKISAKGQVFRPPEASIGNNSGLQGKWLVIASYHHIWQTFPPRVSSSLVRFPTLQTPISCHPLTCGGNGIALPSSASESGVPKPTSSLL